MKENIYLELVYSFRGPVHYHHGRKHGSIQADLVLGKYLRVKCADSKADMKRLTLLHWVELEHRISTYLHSDTFPPTRPPLF